MHLGCIINLSRYKQVLLNVLCISVIKDEKE